MTRMGDLTKIPLPDEWRGKACACESASTCDCGESSAPTRQDRRIVRLGVWLKNLRAWKTARANRDLQRAMKKNPDFAHAWQCNIAMPILDGSDGKLTPREANEIADRIMAHLFNVKTNDKS